MKLPPYHLRFAHLAALWAYGVSQPVFSMLKGNPEFLVVRGSTRTDVVVFAVLLAVVPPLLVVAVEALASLLSRSLSGALHVIAVWGFAFLAALQLSRLLDVERGAVLLLPAAGGLLVAFAYLKLGAFRSFLSLSLLLPVAGLLAFVATVPLAVDDQPAADIQGAKKTPVVLVVFDEFPVSSIMRANGSIDALRYPNFARLAQQGTWYPHATSVHESTTQAVPAVLTGRLPRHGELPTLADHPDNLFTLLGRRFAIHASEQVTRLCPSRYCPRAAPAPLIDRQRGLLSDVSIAYLHRVPPQALVGELPPIGERWGGFGKTSDMDPRERVLGAVDEEAWLRVAIDTVNQKQRGWQFDSFLQALRAPHAQPPLLFEHALLPHSPWRFLPSGLTYPDSEAVAGIDANWQTWKPSRWLVDIALQRHLLQVGYADRLLGVMVRRLKAVGLYKRALVIVTADHGASFEPNGYMRSVMTDNLADIAGVPLFIKYPDQRRGRVDRRSAQTIDIVPTVADVVGVEIPWSVDGHSLRADPVMRQVAVSKLQGDPVVGDPAVVEAGVLKSARRNARLFGEGSESVYRLGPYKGLLARAVDLLAPSKTTGVVRFDDAGLFADVRLSSRIVPARIAGAIEDLSVAQGTPLAIAVNGSVQAMTRAYLDRGQSRFEALVPEAAFHDGRNTVDVYSVARTAGVFRLAHVGGTSPASKRAIAASGVTPTDPRG